MIKHNIKLVFRNLWRKKTYAFVILLSLMVGFVCANLLISFLIFETSTDTFHSKAKRTFQVFTNDPFGGTGRISYIPAFCYDYLTTTYPEVEKVCQIGKLGGVTIENGKDTFQDFTVISVDSSFLNIFDFPKIEGEISSSINRGKIVLTKDKALVLFNKTQIVGSTVSITTSDTTLQLLVSAVIDKPKEHTHLSFDAIVHHTVLPEKWNGGASYLLLTEAGASKDLAEKINKDPQRPGLIGPGTMQYFLDPLTHSYFSTDNKMGFIKTRNPMFINIGYIVCALILFIASFNFINLFLLFWQDRKRQIGIKKVLGVSARELFSFSVVEACVYIIVAYLLALSLSSFLIPVFNDVFDANLSTKYLLNIKVVSSIALVLFIAGSVVVFIAVFKQWRMNAINLISRESGKISFNRSLFTLQFIISTTLAICTITIMQQINYLQDAPLGFNRNIIQLNTPDPKLSSMLQVLKQRLSQLPEVNNVTSCSGNPISGNMVVRHDLENGEFYNPYIFEGDDAFLKTLQLQLIEGEQLSEMSNGKLVNEKLIKQFNINNAVGELIPGTKDKIAGVVKDFTCSSFKQEIPPVIISYNPEGKALLIDYDGNSLTTLLPQLEAEWKKVFKDYQFSYKIIQEDLINKYKDESVLFKIIISFSLISMVLSCFGLFALSWAVIQSRTKEMGIRKVLGASSIDVLNLLTLTFTKRIAIAFALAAPLGYYLMSQWLTRFTNKIDMNLSIYSIAALVVLVIAALTLSVQTIKASMINPVDEIRNE